MNFNAQHLLHDRDILSNDQFLHFLNLRLRFCSLDIQYNIFYAFIFFHVYIYFIVYIFIIQQFCFVYTHGQPCIFPDLV